MNAPHVVLTPMTQAEYEGWRAAAEVGYAQSFVDAGALALADAQERSVTQFAELLPDGLATPGHLLMTARDGDQRVGMIWLELTETAMGLEAFGYDFRVEPALRRRGYGRAVMLATERECVTRGVVAVGLNVFGHNDGARALYESMGFEVVSTNMKRHLGGSHLGGSR